jgi:hypothetical protein
MHSLAPFLGMFPALVMLAVVGGGGAAGSFI